jgi:hypothetical protein
VAGKFDTPDSFGKVRDFYQDRLTAQDGPLSHTDNINSNTDLDGGDVGNFEGVDHEGKTVFKLKLKDDMRVVTLKGSAGGTRIELVRIRKSGGEGN